MYVQGTGCDMADGTDGAFAAAAWADGVNVCTQQTHIAISCTHKYNRWLINEWVMQSAVHTHTRLRRPDLVTGRVLVPTVPQNAAELL